MCNIMIKHQNYQDLSKRRRQRTVSLLIFMPLLYKPLFTIYSVILEMIDTLTRYYVHSIKSKLRKGREIDGLHSRGNLLEHADLLEQKKALS